MIKPRSTPIFQLRLGAKITPRFELSQSRIRTWKYTSECDQLFGGLVPGVAALEIVEFSKTPGKMWVRARLPGRTPPAFLKISGEEYAMVFRNYP